MRVNYCRLAAQFPLVLLALGACSPALNWRQVQVAQSPLTATWPCKPISLERQVVLVSEAAGSEPPPAPTAGNASLPMRLMHCEAGGALWGLGVVTVADAGNMDATLQALQRQLAANLAGEAIERVAFEVPGMTPRASAGLQRGRGRGRDGQPNRFASAVFSHGLQVYQASLLVPASVALPTDAEVGFFQSLQLRP